MEKNKFYKKIKRTLQIILIALVIFLIAYIVIFIVGGKEDDLLVKATTFFRAFTIGVDTKIEDEDNTILDSNKKVEIEDSVGSVKVEDDKKQPVLQTEKKEVENYAAPISNSASSLYYNQLDEYGKIIYTKLKNESAYFLEGEHSFDFGYGFNDLLNTAEGDTILKQSFQYAINSLLFDYPELFFVDIENLALAIERTEYNNKTAVNKVLITNLEGKTFYIKGLNSKEEVNTRREAIYNVRNKVLKATENMKTYDKIKYIQNYIIDKTEYDKGVTRDNIYNISGPLLDGYAVCEGYAKAFKFLMDGAKIPTVLIAGKAYDNGSVERHAWNYVELNGRLYLVDTTWNDPIISGTGGLPADPTHRSPLVARNVTKTSHIEDGNIVGDANFEYPELSEYSFGR